MMTQSYSNPSSAAALVQLARLKAGLSQRELAERAGVPTTMISAYERDKRQPTLATLLRLLRAAGFDLRMRLEPYEPGDDAVERLDSRQAERWRQARPAVFNAGYAELIQRAHRVVIDGVEITIADLDDVIRSKELAGRRKDLLVLPALYRYRASRSDKKA